MKKLVLFQGDSVTDCSRNRDNRLDLGHGYVAICAEELKNEKNLILQNTGVSGDRVCHLRERWTADCMNIKPDILSIAIGVNEVLVKLYEDFFTPLDEFERDYRILLDAVKKDLKQTKIMIVSPFIMQLSDEMRMLSENLQRYLPVIKRLADEYADGFLDMQLVYDEHLKSGLSPVNIAIDGIHPTPLGHYIFAQNVVTVLKKLI